MNALNRLLISDARRMLGQGLAICAVLASGVATFVMSTSTIRSLEFTRQRYYRDYQFADAFVQLKRAPNQLAARFREIPGVAQVETRVVRDVILDIPGMIEPATCRLASIPSHPGRGLNRVHLRSGRLPNSNRRGEVVASELFAEANRLRPGDSVSVVMGGRREQLHIVGLAMSPEYIFAVQPGQLLPDNRRFGVLWMPYRQMASAFNMEGAFNDASFTLLPRASLDDVIFHIDNLTTPYGGFGAYGRHQQASHRRISDEILQLRSMAVVTPSIFMAVAAFLVNLVLSRIVHHQREQIATLRAFGYTPRRILLHYLKMVLLVVFGGVVCGTAVGLYLARGLVANYGDFFRFPSLYYRLAGPETLLAAIICLATVILGAASALRRAAKLPPAVAMRPESPRAYRRTFIERIGLGGWLSPILLMILRRLERNYRSSLLSVLGMSFGVAILVLGSFFEDTINYVMEVQFQRAQRQDVTLTFGEVISPGGLHSVRQLPGVLDAEPFRATAVRVRRGARSRRVSLMGLEQETRLFRVLDQDERQVTLERRGLTISKKLSELLGVQPGQSLTVEFLEGARGQREVFVAAVFPDYTEPGVYLERTQLHELLGEGECLSGAFLLVDQRRMEDLHAALKQTPAVAAVTVTDAAMKSFEELMAENLLRMRAFNIAFASIISFGVVYNCALITLAERSRDLATLRVLGFTRREVSAVLLGELVIITLLSLPIGLPIGYGLSYLSTIAMDTESNRFPLVVSRATFAFSAVVIMLAAASSALVVRRMLDRLDMIAVLKIKE